MRVLGIETSCDETGVAIYDTAFTGGRGLLGTLLGRSSTKTPVAPRRSRSAPPNAATPASERPTSTSEPGVTTSPVSP